MGEIKRENSVDKIPEVNKPLQAVLKSPEEIQKAREQVVAEMRVFASGLKKERSQILPYLNEDKPYESKEYAVLLITQNPEAKAHFARIIVGQCVKEGDWVRAVTRLMNANAAELSLPESEFGLKFIADLYAAALAEGKFGDARRIANMMLREEERRKIVNLPDSEWKNEAGAWSEREQKAFEGYAEFILAKPILPDDKEGTEELSELFGQLKNRPGGFATKLGRGIALKYIVLLQAQKNFKQAEKQAKLAGMSKEEIEKLHESRKYSLFNRLMGNEEK